MTNIGSINLDLNSIQRSINGDQLCFLSQEQIGNIGDTFYLYSDNKIYYFKIIDIWNTPKEFVKKFLWRLCGLSNDSDIDDMLSKVNNDMIFAHLYCQLKWTNVQNMVVT